MSQLSTRPLAATEIESVAARLFEGFLEKFGDEDKLVLVFRASFSIPSLDQTIAQNPPKGRSDWRGELAAKLRPLKDLHYVEVLSWQIALQLKAGPNINVMYGLENGGIVGWLKITEVNNQVIQPNILLPLLSVLENSLPLTSRKALAHASLSETQRSQLEYQEQILAELQSASTRLSREATDFMLASEQKNTAEI